MRKGKWFLYGFGWVIAGLAMITLMGIATMYLWNWLVPQLFNGTTITVFEAIGLLALGKLLTGFMWRGSWGGHRGWRHHGRYNGYWRSRWENKMQNMTPEEREKFKNYYYSRCGWNCGPEMNSDKKEEAKQNGNDA